MPTQCIAGGHELILLHSELLKTSEITANNAKLKEVFYNFQQNCTNHDGVISCNPKACTN